MFTSSAITRAPPCPNAAAVTPALDWLFWPAWLLLPSPRLAVDKPPKPVELVPRPKPEVDAEAEPKPGATPVLVEAVWPPAPPPKTLLMTVAKCLAEPFCTGYTKSCASLLLSLGRSKRSIHLRASSRLDARELTTRMLLMRSIGMIRTAPKNGFDSAIADAAAPPPLALEAAPAGFAPPCALDAWAAPPPVISRRACSTSRTVACLRGTIPTDIPLSKLTSKVLMISSHPSAWVRVPPSTSRLRRVSTRSSASGAIMGRRMVAISAAPMYCRGTITAPLPGGSAPYPTTRGAETMPLSASGFPTWYTPRASRAITIPLACSALSSKNTAWSAGTSPRVANVTFPATG